MTDRTTEGISQCPHMLEKRCVRPWGHKGFCSSEAADPAAYTREERDAMEECPLALQSVIDYHHVQEAEGDAMGYDVKGNEARRKALEVRRDALLAKCGEPTGDIRWTSKPHEPCESAWKTVNSEMPPKDEAVYMRRTGSPQIPMWQWQPLTKRGNQAQADCDSAAVNPEPRQDVPNNRGTL